MLVGGGGAHRAVQASKTRAAAVVGGGSVTWMVRRVKALPRIVALIKVQKSILKWPQHIPQRSNAKLGHADMRYLRLARVNAKPNGCAVSLQQQQACPGWSDEERRKCIPAGAQSPCRFVWTNLQAMPRRAAKTARLAPFGNAIVFTYTPQNPLRWMKSTIHAFMRLKYLRQGAWGMGHGVVRVRGAGHGALGMFVCAGNQCEWRDERKATTATGTRNS